MPGSPAWRRIAAPVAVVLVAAVLLVGFTASGVIPSLLKVFEPHSFAPVSVSPTGLGSAGTLLDYGPVTWTPGPPKAEPVADASTARARSGLPVLLPAILPSGVSGPVSYGVISHSTGSLAFDAARLRASALSQGVRVAPMPAAIDHSIIYVNGGPALVELWGATASGATGGTAPTLVIAQTRTPTVESTGASTKQLEDYLLSQPGVPPELAAQIRAIKDPSTTLPIPIRGRPGHHQAGLDQRRAGPADRCRDRRRRGMGKQRGNLRRRRPADPRPGHRPCKFPPLIPGI